jgi:hypothetical protein
MTQSTDQSRTCTDAPQVTTLRPRPPFPAAPTRRTPLSHDVRFDRGAYDKALSDGPDGSAA